MESNAIEERVELSMLYDFYGALLKENQQRMFEACILDDYGYTEIAEEEGISRQAYTMRSSVLRSNYGNMSRNLALWHVFNVIRHR